jgi:Spx/MgsR family transcriptional regulator
MTTLYGIPNCDTVKRARAWLDEQGVAYTFHDFKKQGVPEAELDQWLKEPGWEALVNRRGTTWRKLDEAERNAVIDAASARAVLLANPSLIKRPVVNWGAKTGVTTGFDAQAWAAAANAV